MLLSRIQAFAGMQYFLDQYYWKTIEVQQLTNRMALDQDGGIVDQEIKDMWNKALNLAVTKGPMYFQLK